MAPGEISFGILLIPLQALDIVGPMDILVNITYQRLSASSSQPEAERLGAPKLTFHYIGPTMDPVDTTGNMHIKPTCTLTDCPKLDYLLIGGPAPTYAYNVPEEMKQFIVERSKEVKTIFTTCTGGLVLAATGLLAGVEATTNHAEIHQHGKQISPTTKWNHEKNWVISENAEGVKFWTAAGAVAGMDMIAQWIREEFEYGQDLLNISTMALEWQPMDVDGRPMRYMNGRMEMVEGVAKC